MRVPTAAAVIVVLVAGPAIAQGEVLPASFVVIDGGNVLALDTRGNATTIASGLAGLSAVSTSPRGDSIAVAAGGLSAGEGSVVLLQPGQDPVTLADDLDRPGAVALLGSGSVVFATGTTLWSTGVGEAPAVVLELDEEVSGLVAVGDDVLVAVLDGGAALIVVGAPRTPEVVTDPLTDPGQPAFDTALGLCIPEAGQIRCWDLGTASVTTAVDIIDEPLAVAVVDGLLIVSDAEGVFVVDPASNVVVGGGPPGVSNSKGIARLDGESWFSQAGSPSTASTSSQAASTITTASSDTASVATTSPASPVAAQPVESDDTEVSWGLVVLIVGVIGAVVVAGVAYALKTSPPGNEE